MTVPTASHGGPLSCVGYKSFIGEVGIRGRGRGGSAVLGQSTRFVPPPTNQPNRTQLEANMDMRVRREIEEIYEERNLQSNQLINVRARSSSFPRCNIRPFSRPHPRCAGVCSRGCTCAWCMRCARRRPARRGRGLHAYAAAPCVLPKKPLLSSHARTATFGPTPITLPCRF